MTKISGWVYLIIGAFVSGYSRYIQSKITSPGLTLFFWAGVIFIGIGVFKIVLSFIFKEKKIIDSTSLSIQDKIVNNLGFAKDIPKYDSEKINKERELILNKNRGIVACPKCGTKHYSNSNFCHICGTRLK